MILVLVVVVLGLVVVYLAFKALLERPKGRLVLLGRTIRSRLEKAADRGFVLSPVDDAPVALDATKRILESLGFEPVALGRLSSRGVTSVMVHVEMDVIAKAAWSARPLLGTPQTQVTLLSVASGRGGALVTSNAGFEFEGLPWLVDQVVPYASLDVLAEHHEDARRLLQERGVRFEPVGADDALEVLAWYEARSITSLLELSNEALVEMVFSMARRRIQEPENLASMLEDPTTIARIEAMRADAPSP